MTRISILHVGDIHYPDNKTVQKIDLKDKGLGATLTTALAPHPLKNAMDTLVRVIERDQTVKGLMFAGDLTSRSDVDGYEECVAYLEATLSSKTIWSESHMHVVHGNHDIVRDADTSVDGLARYRPTQASWDNRNLPILHADEVRSILVQEGTASVRIHSVNSCVGCGETRCLPDKVRQEIATVMQGMGTSPINPTDFDLIGEQLDTPAFDFTHVTEVASRIEDGPESVHLLLGHHPVLPQAVPRIEIYTEAINGGLVRTALAELRAGALYCHGHVHDDPIEIVRNVDVGTDIVFISAPLFIEGFNLLTFHFGTDIRPGQNSAVPLGCEVIRYRANRAGIIQAQPPVRIPICRAETFDFLRDDLHRAILKQLTGDPVRFRSLFNSLLTTRGTLTEPALVEHLSQLSWYRLIDIAARNEEPDHWHIWRMGG